MLFKRLSGEPFSGFAIMLNPGGSTTFTYLVAYGHVVQRDGDGFWSDVEVAGQGDGRVVARGTVLYRIVT